MSVTLVNTALRIKGLKPTEKLVLVALCEYANDSGICWPKQKTIAEVLDISTRSVIRAFQDLERLGFIIVSNLIEINLEQSDKMSSYSDKLSPSDSDKKSPKSDKLSCQSDKLSPPIRTVIEPSITIKQKPQKNENRFDEFYEAYPRKISRKDAEKRYSKIILKNNHEKIMRGLILQKKLWESSQTKIEFIPYPATWLNKEIFNDFQEKNEASKPIDIDVLRRILAKNTQETWKNDWFGVDYSQARQLIQAPKIVDSPRVLQ